jgi:type I restriction enzyme R subunit
MIAKGRLIGGGRRANSTSCDYVLTYKGQKLAALEAKRRGLSDTEGLGQAKDYAERLQTRFAYSTNGKGIYQVDMHTGAEGHVDRYPTPDELWAQTFAEENEWRDRFSKVPYNNNNGQWDLRYYKYNAVNAALKKISEGEDRILLTMATGTGKTSVAFEIAWKLFHSRWTKNGDGKRQPRILFLADRNILADQAFNGFSAFPEDALVRIDPAVIRKKGRVPKNGSVFFTIFQTFMSGTDEEGNPSPSFGDYPPDFFDLIVIDECHRGGANDESNWRGILEYFSPAVQLGLTATPKRKHNADTYAYFGEPAYIYSLKEGINDGYLTPFKVKQIATTLDEYVYTPDDELIEGEVEEGRRYTEDDFNRIIEIREREQYRVKLFMEQIDQNEKTLVFCATQEHAAAVRDLINQIKNSNDPNYCVRVTANDGKLGDQYLRTFQDNDKKIPTILTTSQKLSTGVDARNIRNIVLMRPINSMIEFKQIIGRGTRVFEGKDYFTIYDFVEAYKHFNDKEWDGEPLEPTGPAPTGGGDDAVDEDDGGYDDGRDDDDWEDEPKRAKIKLADGKERTIQNIMATTFWSPDGKPMSAKQFVEKLFGELPDLFKDEDELRALWSSPDTRKALLEGLVEKGFGPEQLAEIRKIIDADKSDIYDVLAHIAFASPPITRAKRVDIHRPRIFEGFDEKLQGFIEFVLAQYINEGVGELDLEKLPQLLTIKYKGVREAAKTLGEPALIRETFVGFQKHLYE